MIALLLSSGTIAFADEIGAGGTGQGNIGGSNVYTFSYIYDAASDAIELKVDVIYALDSFGGTTSHTFTSPSDQIVLHTQYPQLGSSLDSAISSMISNGGYNFTVSEVKSKLNALGYYDKGNGVWKYDGGYLTYISATKIRPEPKKHTVTYNANGGTGSSGNQTKTENITLTLSSTKPTRAGYNFKNWTASIGGTYNPGGNYTHDQDGGTVTMTANWSPWQHTVTYNANGGSGAPGNQTKTYGSVLTLSSTKPTRTGYNFKGWSVSIGGTYQPGSAYGHDQNGGTVTMTAIWEPWTHTVTYDANGGSGAPGNQTKTYGSVLTLSNKVPTKTGYSFKGWDASIGGTYQPGGAYGHDQNGGTVTMKAKWVDDIAPSCSSFTAVPNYWSAGNGTVSFTVRDQGSGLASVKLQRYYDVSKTWSDVKTWSYSGTTESQSGTYIETSEGVFYYRLIITDEAGNTTTKTSNYIYLDHSNSVINGVENTVTDWTNVAPTISVSATDFLYGTSYNGSGLSKIVIKDDAGSIVASGTNSTSYTLAKKYEGKHTWTITATDNVGHASTKTVTTKYDCTAPGIDGTEITFVTPDGQTVSGYCQDNIISQHIDDEISRSPNGANLSSGVKSVILYRVTGNTKEVINTNQTKKIFTSSDTHSYFDMYYEIADTEKRVSYYEIIVVDFAGNTVKKKLTSQYSILSWFHTSIDRSSYSHN